MFNVLGTIKTLFCLAGMGGKVVISSNFSEISECPVQKMFLSAVMLNMLSHVESPPPLNVLLSDVMLNMLNMLNVLGTMRALLGGRGGQTPKHSTYSTYATCQLKEAFWGGRGFKMIQQIQHDSRKKRFWFAHPWHF